MGIGAIGMKCTHSREKVKFNYLYYKEIYLNYLVQLNLYKDYCNVFNYFFFENHFEKVIKKWEI